MTQKDTIRYTEAVQNYETHKKHFYFTSHDDRRISDYLKGLVSNKRANIIGVVGFLVLVLFFGGFFGFMTKHYAASFKYSIIALLSFYVYSMLCNCLLYLNYINPSYKNMESLDIIAFIATFIIGWKAYRLTNNVYIGIISVVLVILGFVLLTKSLYFENCNIKPRIDDYDSDLNDNRIDVLKNKIVKEWIDFVSSCPHTMTTALLRKCTAQMNQGILYIIAEDQTAYLLFDEQTKNDVATYLKNYVGSNIDFVTTYQPSIN